MYVIVMKKRLKHKFLSQIEQQMKKDSTQLFSSQSFESLSKQTSRIFLNSMLW
jgi:hypothetical protein